MGYRVVIIGGGFAGASTAYHLAKKNCRDLLVLEQEKRAGIHSSGRSAGMIRQVIPDPLLLPLVRAGALFFNSPPEEWRDRITFHKNGSLLLGVGDSMRILREEAEEACRAEIPATVLSPSEVVDRVPVLARGNFEGAVWSPEDGFVDAPKLLSDYLDLAARHGAGVCYGAKVREIRVEGAAVVGVETASELIETSVVVNASGAWANEIAGMAGGAKIPFRPCRRHLFLSEALPWIDPDWPFVWDVAHEVYFRPESGGLLFSPCDEEPASPGIPETEPGARRLLEEKIRSHFPGLFPLWLERAWAGLRTLTPDGRFVMGWDPNVKGLFWVAGLGGHGVTTSYPVGALAAEMLMGRPQAEWQPLSPARFF